MQASYFFLFLKGLAMGAADVVPGVSGGTIAFITGIYERLLNAIRSVNGTALQLLLRGRIAEFWKHTDATFLLVLVLGVGTAFVSLAKLITFLLKAYPEMLWAFFFGLIAASAFVVSKQVRQANVAVWLIGIVGALVAYFITVAVPAETPTALWFIFLSGAIAICAMILPGISGSFILVLLGKYEYMMQAIKTLQIKDIAVFIVGAVMGLLSFSHLISWALRRYHDLTIALLTGFMVGALNKVWPWKQTLKTYTDRHGEAKPLVQQNVWPWEYTDLTGQADYLLYCVLLAVLGFGLVYLLSKFSPQPSEAPKQTA
jgi:putative membrane protein